MASLVGSKYRAHTPVSHEVGKSRMAIARQELDLIRHVAHECQLFWSEDKKKDASYQYLLSDAKLQRGVVPMDERLHG